MAQPDVNEIAQRIYDEIAPATAGDEERGWPLLHFINAWTQPMLLLEGIARDQDDRPGWASVMHPDTAPSAFLDWLSRFVGSVPVPGESEAQARIRIKGMSGLRRGGIQAMTAAAKRHLVGPDGTHDTATVQIVERVGGSAWKLTVATKTSETPDPAATLKDIMEQKPAGMVLTHVLITGGDFTTVASSHATFDAVTSSYYDFNELKLQPSKRETWTYAQMTTGYASYNALTADYHNYTDLMTPTT